MFHFKYNVSRPVSVLKDVKKGVQIAECVVQVYRHNVHSARCSDGTTFSATIVARFLQIFLYYS